MNSSHRGVKFAQIREPRKMAFGHGGVKFVSSKGGEVGGVLVIFATFLTRHLVRHSTECEGGSSKSDGWFVAKKWAAAGKKLNIEGLQ